MTAAASEITRGRASEGNYSLVRGSYVLFILLLAGITSYLDRNILYLLVEPIKQTLEITDTQISLLEGMAFAIFFVTFGIPLGALVDRWNRRNMIVAGVLIWSVMTMMCGLAQNYEQLFLARMGVGFGEAILGPAAYSIIADYFPPSRRARAASVYNLSNFLGGGASALIGGALIHLIGTLAIISVPVVGDIVAWKAIFIVAGIPGFFIALLMLTVKEPVRSEKARVTEKKQGFWKYLNKNRKAYICVYASYVLMTFVGLSTSAWGPSYLIRRFGIEPSEAGFYIGLLSMTAIIGVLSSGWLSDYFARLDKGGRRFRTPLAGWPLLLIGLLGYLLAPGLTLVLVFSGLMFIGGGIILVSCPPVLQDITPNEFRGRAQALFFVLSMVMGMGIAPTAVALVNDYVFGDPAMLQYALLVVQLPSVILGWIVCLLGQKYYAQARIDHLHNLDSSE